MSDREVKAWVEEVCGQALLLGLYQEALMWLCHGVHAQYWAVRYQELLLASDEDLNPRDWLKRKAFLLGAKAGEANLDEVLVSWRRMSEGRG